MVMQYKSYCSVRMLIGILCVLIGHAIAPRHLGAKPDTRREGYPSQYGNEQTFQDYTVRTYFDYDTGMGTVEIFHRQVNVYSKTSESHFYIGQPGEPGDPAYDTIIEMGTDITGRGMPNLVISEWTLGAHCCFHFYVFELGTQVQLLAELDAGHSDNSHFADVDHDTVLEFITNDWTFAYWYTSFAGSPAPGIILRFANGKYVLAADLMYKPLPPNDMLQTRMNEIHHDTDALREWKEWKQPPPDIWDVMLDLLYSGHETMAYTFFEQVWLPEIPGKEEFLEAFRDRLRHSPYWPQLIELNRRYDHP